MSGVINLPNIEGGIKWLPEPVLLGYENKTVNISPQYGIFYIVVSEYDYISTINNKNTFKQLTNTGFTNDDTLFERCFLLSSSNTNMFMFSFKGNNQQFSFLQNSLGEKLSSISYTDNIGISIYKIAEIN